MAVVVRQAEAHDLPGFDPAARRGAEGLFDRPHAEDRALRNVDERSKFRDPVDAKVGDR